jgi:hypothetical protein
MRFKALSALGVALLFVLSLATPAAAEERVPTITVERVPTTVDLSAVVQQVSPGTVTPLDASCPTYHLCVWWSRNYGGAGKTVYGGDDQGWRETSFQIRSAKNQFTERAVGFYNINTGLRVRCLNPRDQRPGPFPDATRLIYIGALGSRC